MKKLTINVSSEFLFENHNINANEDGRPKEADGKFYLSGNKTRFMIFEKMKDFIIVDGINSLISTSDSITGDIINDIRSDLGGFMITEGKKTKKNEEGKEIKEAGSSTKRVSPLKVAFSFSREQSNYFEDLFVKFSNTDDKSDQRINNRSYSLRDVVDVNTQLNIDEVGREKRFNIVDKKFIKEENKLLITEEEKINRLKLFLLSVGELKGLANFSRNATNNTPDRIFISFAENRKFVKYFQMTTMQQQNYLKTLEPGSYFIGDDNSNYSVNDAITDSIEWLKNNTVKLYI